MYNNICGLNYRATHSAGVTTSSILLFGVVPMKKCSKCNEEKELSCFGRRKTNLDGLKGICKSCTRAYGKMYFQENKERLTEKNKQWAHDNKDRVRESQKKYYSKNAKSLNLKGKIWRDENKEHCSDKRSVYYCNNKESLSIALKKWKHSERGKNSISASTKKTREKYPEKRKANICVANAISSGKLIREKSCECCGDVTKIQAHHESYKKENWLKVVWLCVPCHSKQHPKKESKTWLYKQKLKLT